ncbi:hypothetical protein NDU88_006683 [Pleurodeles waltl]|uniref:Uncharacterized protein n=1 Tax=Pleurodeles waltl TaxID=8319 RepID=A0AAV7PM33_PLEWA|nr:hypothetical protein NDU88_006683 [Pleurodeles waltl]
MQEPLWLSFGVSRSTSPVLLGISSAREILKPTTLPCVAAAVHAVERSNTSQDPSRTREVLNIENCAQNASELGAIHVIERLRPYWLQRHWRGQIYATGFSSYSRGALLWVDRGTPFTSDEVATDPESRYVFVKGRLDACHILLRRLYALMWNK